MDLSTLYFLTTVLVFILEHEAHSTSTPGPGLEEEGPLTQLVHRPRRRDKRCSCENLKDKECVYFCHIGIVWVNTPGQIVPYGVGPFPGRLRREADLYPARLRREAGLYPTRLRREAGLYPARLRREAGRCHCAEGGDAPCLHFCSASQTQKGGEGSWMRRVAAKVRKRYKAEAPPTSRPPHT